MNIEALWKDPDYSTHSHRLKSVTIIDILSYDVAAIVDTNGYITCVNLTDLQVVDKKYLPE